MSTISIKQIERNRSKTAGRNRGALHACAKCDGEEASTSHYPRKAQRREQCATVINILLTAQPSVARSVTASLASSGTTPGEPASVQRSALPASRHARRTIADGYLGFKPSDMPPNVFPPFRYRVLLRIGGRHMKFILVNGRTPRPRPFACAATSRSKQVTCEKSGRTSPTAITIATPITAKARSCFSKNRQRHHERLTAEQAGPLARTRRMNTFAVEGKDIAMRAYNTSRDTPHRIDRNSSALFQRPRSRDRPQYIC